MRQGEAESRWKEKGELMMRSEREMCIRREWAGGETVGGEELVMMMMRTLMYPPPLRSHALLRKREWQIHGEKGKYITHPHHYAHTAASLSLLHTHSRALSRTLTHSRLM